jgi:adenine deaminase
LSTDPRALQAVALGQLPADLVVRGGTLLCVYTNEWLEGWGLAVKGDRIAAIGPELDYAVGPDTAVVDARSRYLIPGLVEAHSHQDVMTSAAEFARMIVPRGCTTAVGEISNMSNIGGVAGVRAFLEGMERLPFRSYAVAPMISFLCSDRGDGNPLISVEEMEAVLDHPRILGLGEIYWPMAVPAPEGLVRLVAAARRACKAVDGHSAGARGGKLQAFAGLGVTSCHEPITDAEVVERLRLGLDTMVREGAVRQDMDVLKPLIGQDLDLRRICFITDGPWPDVLMNRGFLDHLYRRAVGLGMTPAQALRAITLHPAEHFGLDRDLGGLAPGRLADFCVVTELESLACERVYCGGRLVAQEGKLTAPVAPNVRLRQVLPEVRLPDRMEPHHFAIPATAGRRALVRLIEAVANIVNREVHEELPVRDGRLVVDPAAGYTRVAAMDRFGQGRMTLGAVKGFGLKRGALAVSYSFDCANLVVIGANETDMAVALNRMAELGGGFVVAEEGRIGAELPLEVGGGISEAPVEELAARLTAVQEAARQLGFALESPLVATMTLTFSAVPSLRIRERGLIQVRSGRPVDLFVSPDELHAAGQT